MSKKHDPLSLTSNSLSLGGLLRSMEDSQPRPAPHRASQSDAPVSAASMVYTAPEHNTTLDLIALLEDLPQKIQEAVVHGVVEGLKARGGLPIK